MTSSPVGMIETDEAETAALRNLLERRRRESFLPPDEARNRTEAMIERKRAELDL